MTTLKTFEKMNTSARTMYNIFKDDCYVETLEVFYVETLEVFYVEDEPTADHDDKLKEAVIRRMELEESGAKVKFVDYSKSQVR